VNWSTERRPLITVFSFLSCYGDERAMLEDVSECWRDVENRVRFRFVPAVSSVAGSCVPLVTGHRYSVLVSIPLPNRQLEQLSKGLSNGEWMTICPVLWNMGVNHEATLASRLGDASLEVEINKAAMLKLTDFLRSRSLDSTAFEALTELQSTVQTQPSNKNMAIFRWAMAITEAVNGISVISCKSGKDRTSMAITLEEGRIIRENCAITQHQMAEIVASLRRDGVRRDNCRKNVGKALYAFSPFQLQFLPKELRPPAGTYGNQVQT